MNRRSRIAFALAFAACWTVAGAAQEAVSESIEVRVTTIDVVVSDSYGRFVHGLTRDDFAIYDNGKLQPLTNFADYAADTGAPEANADRDAPRVTPPRAAQSPQVTILILLDQRHLRPASREHAAAAVKRFVAAHMDNGITYVLASYDRSLHLHRVTTADEVTAAVAALSRNAVSSQEMEHHRRQTLEMMQTERSPDRVYRMVIDYATMERHEIEQTVSAVHDAIASIAGAEGPKRLLYISDGIPQAAAPELFRYYDDRFHSNTTMAALSFDLSREWQRVAAHANAADVAMYMLQAGGATSQELSPIDAPTTSTKLDLSTVRDNTIGMLRLLADETGGAAIVDTNSLDAPLATLATDLLDYYSLGYRTPKAASGPHSVTVEVKRPGLQVRYRKSYSVRSADDVLTDAVLAQFYAPRNENPLNAHLRVEVPRKAGQKNWSVAAVLTIPHESFISDGTITCALAVMDAAGDHTSVKRLKVAVHAGKNVVLPINLTIGAGEQILALAVRDDTTASTSFLLQTIAESGS